MSQTAASQPASQAAGQQPARQPPAASWPASSTTFPNSNGAFFNLRSSCGGMFGDRKNAVPKHTPTTDLKLKSATFQIEMWCSWLASWRPAVAWPAAAQLPGWPQAGPPANQLADGRENQHCDWRTGNCLAGLSVFA